MQFRVALLEKDGYPTASGLEESGTTTLTDVPPSNSLEIVERGVNVARALADPPQAHVTVIGWRGRPLRCESTAIVAHSETNVTGLVHQ